MSRSVRSVADPGFSPSVRGGEGDATAPRNQQWERALARAIEGRVLVELIYERETAARSFAPQAMFWSPQGGVSVTGLQLFDAAAPAMAGEVRDFEVGRVRLVRLTERQHDLPSIDREAAKYRNGIVCAL
jgi:hypothetical protein